MAEFQVQARVQWPDDPLKRLGDVKQSLKNRICRQALKSALTDLRNVIKKNAPKQTGALKMSLGIKVGTSKATTWGRVGPKMSYSKFKKGKLKTPWRYAAPLVRGHGKTVGNDFYSVSFNRQAILNKMRDSIEKQVQRQLDKAADVPF